VNATIGQKLARCKQRIEQRLDRNDTRGSGRPMLTASNIRYESADRARAISSSGIGMIHALVKVLGGKTGRDSLNKLRPLFLSRSVEKESKLGQPARYNHRFARWFFGNSTPCVPSGPSARTDAGTVSATTPAARRLCLITTRPAKKPGTAAPWPNCSLIRFESSDKKSRPRCPARAASTDDLLISFRLRLLEHDVAVAVGCADE
jgi:hypothetical protein